jgi:hypothetical protein
MAKLLSDKAIRRTAEAVRWVERQPQNHTRGRVTREPVAFEMCRFELAEDLTPSGTAEAYRVSYDSTDGYTAETDWPTITVVDFLGTRRAETGRKGLAFKAPDREEWEIWDLEHQARWIEFTADGAFTTSDASPSVDGIIYHDGYAPATEPTTVENYSISSNRQFYADDNDKGQARFDPDDGKYYIDQMECP